MKKFLILTVAVICLISCKEGNKKGKAISESLTNKVEVIDFHSTHRCMTCNAIEANTKYTLNTFFADEMANEKITLKIVNVDLDENSTVAEKFEATGTSLFLNVIVDGKETIMDLTEFAFMNGNDKETFSKELKDKLTLALEKL